VTPLSQSNSANSGAIKNAIFSAIVFILSILVALALMETMLRIKNSSMRNYDIEMWRYAKELKVRSPDPLLGHEHVPSTSATLQSVEIRLNQWGLRGGELPPKVDGARRILFLGSSVTLGWGVAEDQTITEDIRRKFALDGQTVEVLNAGIGNYNTARYVHRFLTKLTGLQPTDIVVHYFLRDAEELDAGGGNFALRNSELAVTLWIVATRYFDATGSQALEDHYREVYRPTSDGFRQMVESLGQLTEYARANNIRLYLAMTPDVHDLTEYKFGYVHDMMHQVAAGLGMTYVDLLPAMRNLSPQDLWAMPGDPHPNALGHRLMADALYPALRNPGAAN
jgi:lysophospholipase L1-like esterase